MTTLTGFGDAIAIGDLFCCSDPQWDTTPPLLLLGHRESHGLTIVRAQDPATQAMHPIVLKPNDRRRLLILRKADLTPQAACANLTPPCQPT